jgi:hypothetical protein
MVKRGLGIMMNAKNAQIIGGMNAAGGGGKPYIFQTIC